MGKRRILDTETILDICRMFREAEGYETIKKKHKISQRLIETILKKELGAEEYASINKENQRIRAKQAGQKMKGVPNPKISEANKGRIPWNIGIKMSQEFCDKISESNKHGWETGTRTTEKCRIAGLKAAETKRANGKMAEHSINHRKWMLENSPLRGKKTSAETKQKQRDAKLHFYQNGGISPRLGKKMPAHISEMSRARTIQMWKDGKFKFVSRSKIEISIFESVKSHHVDAQHSFNVFSNQRLFIFDIYVPSQNLLIEVNGDYWHANPKIYDESRDAYRYTKTTISAIRERDAFKLAAAEQQGFKTLVVWQSEIEKFDPKLLLVKTHT